MNIYLITRREPCNTYDIYVGAIVYAENADEARDMHPHDGRSLKTTTRSLWAPDMWVKDPKEVVAKLIGTAPSRKRPGVIMSDFRAG